MANTTNFNWETPDDTDLVKDGAAAIRTLGSAIDTSLVDLKGGTTGQVLSKATNTDMDFTWVAQDDSNAIQNAIVDAKGDIVAASAADTPARLAVGTDNQRLVAASSEATGLKYVSDTQNTVIDAAGDLVYGTAADTLGRLAIGTAGQVLKVNAGATAPEWGAAAGGSAVGCVLYKSADQSINNGTWTALTFNTEEYDTDSFHDNSTNTSRITIPSGKNGKYLFVATVVYNDSSSTGVRSFGIYKNGNAFGQLYLSAGVSSFYTIGTGSRMLDAVATDYFEIHAYQNSGGALNIIGGQTYTRFQVQYLGA